MKGLYSTTGCIYIYIAEGGINENIVAVETGYKDSSKDHFYWSRGMTEEASTLYRRERACGCHPCLKTIPEECELVTGSGLESGVNPQGTQVKLFSAKTSAEARHTRNARNPLPEFCKSLKVENNVIVRIADEEREINPDEDYFVARIEERANN